MVSYMKNIIIYNEEAKRSNVKKQATSSNQMSSTLM